MWYFPGYSSVSPLSEIPMPRAGFTMVSVQMATPGVANQFQQHGLKSALGIVFNIISSGMFVLRASVA